MGLKSDFPGIEQHGHVLRVSFPFQGQRCRELLGWEPTQANWARAAKLRADVLRAINAGTFQYATYFPNSPRAAAKTRNFHTVAQEWLDAQELAHSTGESYTTILNRQWLPRLGKLAIGEITPGVLKRAIKDCGFKTTKTRNNAVSPLRMVFEFAQGEHYISENPAAGIKHLETESPESDPFTLQEMQKILAWLKKYADEQMHNYFRYAFFSGLRSSELIALQWSKVDFNNGSVRVDAAQVLGRVKKTKTEKARDVEMNAQSRATLLSQKKHTFLAGQHVFLNGGTGKPYYNHQAPWLALRACMKAEGIRHRPAYNTRHSYATMLLMAGSNPYWVSKQLGHASLEMTLKVYGKWIKGADQGREIGKLDTFLGQSLGQKGVIQGFTG